MTICVVLVCTPTNFPLLLNFCMIWMYDKLFVNHSSVLSELLHFRANDFSTISAAQLSSVWLVVPLASKSSCPDLQTGAKLCSPWVMPCQRSDGGDGAECFQHQLLQQQSRESEKTAATGKEGCRKHQSSFAHTHTKSYYSSGKFTIRSCMSSKLWIEWFGKKGKNLLRDLIQNGFSNED